MRKFMQQLGMRHAARVAQKVVTPAHPPLQAQVLYALVLVSLNSTAWVCVCLAVFKLALAVDYKPY